MTDQFEFYPRLKLKILPVFKDKKEIKEHLDRLIELRDTAEALLTAIKAKQTKKEKPNAHPN